MFNYNYVYSQNDSQKQHNWTTFKQRELSARRGKVRSKKVKFSPCFPKIPAKKSSATHRSVTRERLNSVH